MRFHQIDVDDEVMEYLKSRAEPFVDNPNSVLRRELLVRTPSVPPTAKSPQKVGIATAAGTPMIRIGTPQALRQILEVVHIVRKGTHTRSEATAIVAKALRVAPQTVLDKYCRQLGLNATQFDRLLDQKDMADLRALLKGKFPDHREVIDSILRPLVRE